MMLIQTHYGMHKNELGLGIFTDEQFSVQREPSSSHPLLASEIWRPLASVPLQYDYWLYECWTTMKVSTLKCVEEIRYMRLYVADFMSTPETYSTHLLSIGYEQNDTF